VISLKLGFSSDDFGYAVDLGLPVGGPFPRDPEIKVEAMWAGQLMRPGNLFAERRGPTVRLRRHATGDWRRVNLLLPPFDSMVTHCADPEDGLELLRMRDRMRAWRFYDALRTDRDAPARRPQVMTYTPVLAGDGADLAAAIATIQAIGDAAGLAAAVDDAFPGATLGIGGGDHASIEMRQAGLLRPMSAPELSDGTLRYLLLIAALMSPRPPEIMVLNEPEASLHPQLLAPLARLLAAAARTCQVVVVSHSEPLVAALREHDEAAAFVLEKVFGETIVADPGDTRWAWPSR
jgi:predicted ATPase